MRLEKEFNDRLKLIKKRVDSNKEYEYMVQLAKELFESTKEYNIIEKVQCYPNKMNYGCVSFHIKTLPEDVVLKLWWDSDCYYAGFYQVYNEMFDQLLPGTINEQGVMVLEDIDVAESRIMDFLANEEFGQRNIKTIS